MTELWPLPLWAGLAGMLADAVLAAAAVWTLAACAVAVWLLRRQQG